MPVDISSDTIIEKADTIIDKVFACFKKITPALIAMSFATGAILLFLPSRVLVLLGLDNISSGVRTTLGVIFVLSTVLIVTILLFEIWRKIALKIDYARESRTLRKRYIALSPEQKDIINKIMNDKNKSVFLEATSGNVQYLVNNGFIYRPQQYVPFNGGKISAKYIPQPWLIDLYNKNPKLFSTHKD